LALVSVTSWRNLAYCNGPRCRPGGFILSLANACRLAIIDWLTGSHMESYACVRNPLWAVDSKLPGQKVVEGKKVKNVVDIIPAICNHLHPGRENVKYKKVEGE